ncbi:MAG: 2-oxoacid:acceptor oxidoreductase subunit alpha [Candidatus Peregrinibacteria bacterium]|nr:2-oxoacid:acceptor oxidoreductase subunit alpha [Candidatus Peregrinibacteria bacterium]MDZ4244976.1 2-oxoacid:acceptor oxidoreductase subunit alpha [Candidatus Gracilibacteria bacterium]
MFRTTLKIAGESGMGLVSVGTILTKALKNLGFYINMDREYPSLIKGGHSNLQIDFDDDPVHCLSTTIDIVMALDKVGLDAYVDIVREGGVLIHGYEKRELLKDLEDRAAARNVKLVYLPARQVAYSFDGTELMVNMVLLGMLWRVLGFDYAVLEDLVKEQFASKPALLKIDLECLEVGYKGEFKFEEIDEKVDFPEMNIKLPESKPETILVDGNWAIAIGAIQCGVRAYYAYPMSPASSILTHLAEYADETGMLVKQAEDEITSAQMAVGSMFAGTRALVGTSGGGFDLMTETLSLAGMIECPFVVVIAQRPGPATGLPTWTGQGDLNLAIHSSHGEFARIVIAASDQTSCFELIQHAMNYAEIFQVPVVFLTEKVIAETKTTVPVFKQGEIPIERGLVTDEAELATLESADRFRITENGISKRWVPGSTKTFYFGNGDEHKEDGRLTEEAYAAAAMYAKRIRKMDAILEALPEPVVYGFDPDSGTVCDVSTPGKGHADACLSFIGWGSTKSTMIDVIEECEKQGVKVNYLHYEYLYPLKTSVLKQFIKANGNVCLIEGNYTGQLGDLIKLKLQDEEVLFKFKKQFFKYNGRPFFLEEVMEFIMKNKK